MNVITVALTALASLTWLVLLARVGWVAARMLQIEEYENVRFLRWGAVRAWRGHRAAIAGGAVAAVVLVEVALFAPLGSLLVAAGWLAAAATGNALWTWAAPKKALVLTARMRRLFAAAGLLAAAVAAALAIVILVLPRVYGALAVFAVSAGITLVAQTLLVIANVVTKPVEELVRRHYLRRATTRLREIDPLVIAVVGSYGKTSTKHIVAALLQANVETLPTRRSFNTLMGVTRAINEDLQSQHRVFVVEMDAYAPGEIAAICRLVRPRHAIVTSVGPQHLERFGTMSRVAAALYEVITALPHDGAAIVYSGDDAGAALAGRAALEGHRTIRYAMAESGDADVSVSSLRISGDGSGFRWRWPAEQLAFDVRIPLLGAHQALNVSAALALVHVLGYPLEAPVAAAASLAPVEHRLQRLSTAGPLVVIDDSYNANPVGVHNGLDVLAAMNGGVKILVTPGLVELGAVEEHENRRYGEHAAAVCAHVIVVEARPADALCAGLRAGGLAEEAIHRVAGLDEATAVIARITKTGDVVLFANDLPDTYSQR